MKEVVLNKCYGGFCLSKEAYEYLGLEWDGYGFYRGDRTDPKLIECVNVLGDRANGRYAKLAIVDVPDDIDIEECLSSYDGYETIEEPHESW